MTGKETQGQDRRKPRLSLETAGLREAERARPLLMEMDRDFNF